MVKALVLYESRYGSTERAAKELALIIGPAKACRLKEFKGDIRTYDFVVICSPVYSECIDEGMLRFVEANAGVLSKKKVVLLCVCMAEGIADRYLEPFSKLLGDSVVLKAAVAGEIRSLQLNGTDRALVERFYGRAETSSGILGKPDKERFVELALRIKALKDEGFKAMDNDLLLKYAEDFLLSHNTCVLATGTGSRVRATPIEYALMDGCIYILTEGGEKFANIMLNSNVSMGICDAYKSMSELGGMQISGTARIVEPGCGEYKRVLGLKKLDYEKISSMPIALNMLKIEIKKAEFLWSGFGRLGYDIKQTIYSEGGKI